MTAKNAIVPASFRAGFTLIELSIVLVVIALLIGGLLAGQSLIRASQLRGATTDFSMYRNAVTAFKDKYNYLPGDYPQAGQQWGYATGAAADGMDATCANYTTASSGPATCNGDGSGIIADTTATLNYDQYYESYRAWQHLANAGMINGQFTGISGGSRTTLNSKPGTNTPTMSLAGGTWTFRGVNFSRTGSSDYFDETANTSLTLGAVKNGAGLFNALDPLLAPEEALKIDTKMDDGKPATGNIVSLKGSGTINANCTVDGTVTTDYKVTNTADACALLFRISSPQKDAL